MEKKTMGSFIAALRKANGMTQQDLADRLNISNKAVSRWERDECAPDVMLIPALAEILGVTCDELLKGERILGGDEQTKSVKVDKQIKAIIGRSGSNFKMLIWISLALSLVGLVCMFVISYGFFKPLIGVLVMGLFVIAAFVLAAIATSKFRGIKRDNELYDSADETTKEGYRRTLGIYSYTAFCSAILVLAISLPLAFFQRHYDDGEVVWVVNDSVLAFESYFRYFGCIAPGLILLFLTFKKVYCLVIAEQPIINKAEKFNLNLLLLNIFQFAVVILSAVLFFMAPGLSVKGGAADITAYITGLCLLPVNLAIFVAFVVVCKNRKTLILSGIRNVILFIPAILCYNIHFVDVYQSQIDEWWNIEFVNIVLYVIMAIFLISEIIKTCIENKKKV